MSLRLKTSLVRNLVNFIIETELYLDVGSQLCYLVLQKYHNDFLNHVPESSDKIENVHFPFSCWVYALENYVQKYCLQSYKICL